MNDLPEQLAGRNMALKIELVEELRLDPLNANNRPILPISIKQVKQTTCRAAVQIFHVHRWLSDHLIRRNENAHLLEADIQMTLKAVRLLH